MNKNIKIYKKVGNNQLEARPYNSFGLTYELFLERQAVLKRYNPLSDILKENVDQIFKDETNPVYAGNYSGVLAYGEVQSGKTVNMIVSLIRAYSLGFKNVFVLTGNTDSLHKQTVERFEKEINDFNNWLKKDETKDYIQQEYNYKFDRKTDISSIIKFIDLKGLFSAKNAAFTRLGEINKIDKNNSMNVFFVLKNKSNYEKMDFIISQSDTTKGRNGNLIFDDEADWGFEDITKSDQTELYSGLTRIKKFCESNGRYLKYIAFTATPYKILNNYMQDFITDKPILLKSKIMDDGFSAEYIKQYQPFYAGIDVFHPVRNRYDFKNLDGSSNSEINKILNSEHVTKIDNNYDKYELLRLSILLFLVNTFLFNKAKSSEKKDITYGLYFTDTHKEKHNDTYKDVIRVINDYSKILNDNSEEDTNKLMSSIIGETTQSLTGVKQDIEKKIKADNFSISIFLKFFKRWIDINIEDNHYFIVKMSGDESDDEKYDTKKVKDGVNAVFVIGGFKIARGVTFDNLLLEVLTASSQQADSTLQRARWFGYRDLDTLNIMNLIMSEEVYKSFYNSIYEDMAWRQRIENNSKDAN